MAEYQKLCSNEKEMIEMQTQKNYSGIENQTLLKNSITNNLISDKLELIDSSNSKRNYTPPNISLTSDYSSVSKKKIEPQNRVRKGKMLMFFFNKNFEPLIVIGPHWPITLITMLIIDSFTFFYFYFLWNYINIFVRSLGLFLSFYQIFSYLICSLMNPGIPPKELWIENYFKNKENFGQSMNKICKECKIIMRLSDKIVHCDDCNMCIMGMDHHCIWISKCIGQKNKKTFYVFMASTFTLLIYFCLAMFTGSVKKKNFS